MILQPGFYVVNGSNGEILTRKVTKGKGGERKEVEQPVCARTINGAKDMLAVAGNGFCVLYVGVEDFHWG